MVFDEFQERLEKEIIKAGDSEWSRKGAAFAEDVARFVALDPLFKDYRSEAVVWQLVSEGLRLDSKEVGGGFANLFSAMKASTDESIAVKGAHYEFLMQSPDLFLSIVQNAAILMRWAAPLMRWTVTASRSEGVTDTQSGSVSGPAEGKSWSRSEGLTRGGLLPKGDDG